jgi:ABC-type Mn2+/Zn2+ transport system permease subunit
VRSLEIVLLILIALAIVVSLQTVGVALMVAMLVTPAASASLLTRRLPVMMALAAMIAGLSGMIGLYISYYASVASGAAIVLVSTAIFLLVWLARTTQKKMVLGRQMAKKPERF